MQAMSDNPDLARLSGVDNRKVNMLTWAIVGALCAARSCSASKQRATPIVGWQVLLPMFAAAIPRWCGSGRWAVFGIDRKYRRGACCRLSSCRRSTRRPPPRAAGLPGSCSSARAACSTARCSDDLSDSPTTRSSGTSRSASVIAACARLTLSRPSPAFQRRGIAGFFAVGAHFRDPHQPARHRPVGGMSCRSGGHWLCDGRWC